MNTNNTATYGYITPRNERRLKDSPIQARTVNENSLTHGYFRKFYMCTYRGRLYSNVGKANVTFKNTLAFVCVHQGSSFKRSETHLCVYITYVFSYLFLARPRTLLNFVTMISHCFSTQSRPKLGHLSFRGRSFSISS